ncbi:hypothetical protein Tco_1508795 [Tanacetum coccineum]
MFVSCAKYIEPASVAEALKDADWVIAMQDELDQFARLKVWRLVPRPEGKTIIKTKWIFKNKKDEEHWPTRMKPKQEAYGFNDERLLQLLELESITLFLAMLLSFVSKQYPYHVYALDKALYGLKQAHIRHVYDRSFKILGCSGFQKGSSILTFS